MIEERRKVCMKHYPKNFIIRSTQTKPTAKPASTCKTVWRLSSRRDVPSMPANKMVALNTQKRLKALKPCTCI